MAMHANTMPSSVNALMFLRLASLLLLLPGLASALSPISVKGSKLYDDDGQQFFVKGVTYSAGAASNKDILADTSQCQIDAGLIKSLGANTVHVYTVDNTENHDGCMQAFDSQGIYVWLELATPMKSISRVDPEWTVDLYNSYTRTVDAFAKYDNVLAFGVGSEVMIDKVSGPAAPFVKAAARDVKAFRNARGYRPIPISYSSNDSGDDRVTAGEYLACGDEDDTIELYGLITYAWCGNSSYYESGYDDLYEQFQAYNLPIVFSETGCRPNKTDRDFTEVATMLGPVFQAIFSGSIVYEWAMEDSGYGIVEYSNDDHTGFPSTYDEYNSLATVFSEADLPGTSMASYTPSNSAPDCPTSLLSKWTVDPDEPLPTIAGLDLETVTARTTITTRREKGTATGPTTGTATGGDSLSNPDPQDGGRSAGSGGGLGVAAIAGLGAMGGVLALAAVGVFFFLRRRAAKKKKDMGEKAESSGSQEDASAGYGSQKQQDTHKAELPAASVGYVRPRQEMDASQQGRQEGDGGLQEYYGQNKTGGNAVSEAYGDSQQLHEMEGSAPAVSELPSRRD